MNIEPGAIIALDDNKEYVVIKKMNHNDREYVSLLETTSPVELTLAEVAEVDGEAILNPVSEDVIDEIMELIKEED